MLIYNCKKVLLILPLIFCLYLFLFSFNRFYLERGTIATQLRKQQFQFIPSNDTAILERQFREVMHKWRPAGFLPLNATDQQRSESFKQRGLIGEGLYGKVYKVSFLNDEKRFFAQKILQAKKTHSREEYRLSLVTAGKLLFNEKAKLLALPIECYRDETSLYLITDLYQRSLYDFMSANNFKAFPLPQIRHIAYQLINAIAAMHKIGATHGDMKVKNIVLVNDDYEELLDMSTNEAVQVLKNTTIRVIDFSYVTFIEHRQAGKRNFCMRICPEMDLGVKWSFMGDVWNIGSILTKLYRGNPSELYEDKTSLCTKAECFCLKIRRLACLERVIGPYPKELIKKTRNLLHNNGTVKLARCVSAEEIDDKCKSLTSMMRSNEIDDQNFFDLLEQMLRHDPDKRITLPQALEHPFFDALSEEQRTLQ